MIATEPTYILSLPRDTYTNILLQSIQGDIGKKLSQLLMVKFLRQAPSTLLLPFADILQYKKYEIGEYIVKKNDKLGFIGIIASGTCQVIEEF